MACAIRLEANVELLEDLEYLNEYGAEGVGLYRSEFMLSGRPLEQRHRGRAVPDLSQPDRAGGAAAGHHPHLRSRRAAGRRAISAPGAPPHAARPARPAAGPRQSGGVPHAAARAGARVGPRPAAHHVPVRDRRSKKCAQARAMLHEMRLGADADRQIKVGAMIEVPSAALAADLLAPRRRLLHDRHQRPDPVHAWRSIAPTIACRISTSRCIRRCCG